MGLLAVRSCGACNAPGPRPPGPTLVLMFNSCEPPARFVERRPQAEAGGAGPAAGPAPAAAEEEYQVPGKGGPG
jgi:hypothetical protein